MLSALANLLRLTMGGLASLFPSSPFAGIFEVAEGTALGLAWLNWFVPLNNMAILLGLWITAAFAVCTIQIVGRVAGAVGKSVVDTGTSIVGIGSNDIIGGGQ